MTIAKASFIQFLYPFLFEPAQFDALNAAIEGAKWPGQPAQPGNPKKSIDRKLQVWRSDSFPEEDLLPHVARYLNPPKTVAPTARLWDMTDTALTSPRGLGSSEEWFLMFSHGEVPFRLMGIKLSLFCVGVGFVAVCARPLSEAKEDWLNFTHYFRFCDGQPDKVWLRAQRLPRPDRNGQRQQAQQDIPVPRDPFFPSPAGGIATHPKGQGLFGDILDTLLFTALPEPQAQALREQQKKVQSAALAQESASQEIANTRDRGARQAAEDKRRDAEDTRKSEQLLLREQQWWREVFVPGRLLPFNTLYVDGLSDHDQPAFLYQTRKFFHARQTLHPAANDLRLDHPALLPYAQDQWFIFSLDGGAFVAFDAPDTPFFRQDLPSHLRDQYFLLFTLALHQRFALMSLSDQVAQHWLASQEQNNEAGHNQREAVFRRIRDALLLFAARGHFTQVMQRENHHQCYRRWQETFQVDALYREVNDEVREMHNYLLMEQTERIEHAQKEQRRVQEEENKRRAERDRDNQEERERQDDTRRQQEKKAEKRAESLQNRISFLGILIGGPALILGFLGINIKEFTAGDGITAQKAVEWGFGGGLALGVLIALAVWAIGVMGRSRP